MLKRIIALVTDYSNHIGGRLVAVYLLLLIIPIAIISVYGYLYLQNNLQRHLIANAQHQTLTQAHAMDVTLGRIHDDILYLEQHITNATLSRRDDAYVELDAFAQMHPLYHHITWLSNDGHLIAGTLPTDLQIWLNSSDFTELANLALGSIRFVSIHTPNNVDTTQQEALFLAIVRLPIGKLLLNINTIYVMQSINAYVDANADATWQVDWALLMQDNTLLTATQDSILGEVRHHQLLHDVGYFDLPNTTYTIFYQRAGPAGMWFLLHAVEQKALLPNMQHYSTTITMLLLGSMTSVIGLALLAIMRLTEPIRHLEKMVDALRNGQDRLPLPQPMPTGEFHKLIIAFNQMAEELEVRQKNERALIEQLINAQEEERKRIAYDLHDGMLQDLVGARFYINEARETSADISPPQSDNPINQSYKILTQTIAEGRRIMQGLHPTVLEDLGLEAALSELCQANVEKGGWRTNCDIGKLSHQPERSVSVTIYRIAQEALSNIFRHAHAHNVTMCLSETSNAIELHIKDDGIGFDPTPINVIGGNHWGIRTMQERAQMMGGQCTIISSPSTGTTIHICIPFEHKRVNQ